MSANDKAAATYGRQPMTIAETLAVHEWDYDAKNDACCCKCNGWTGPGPSGDEENDTWERHVAEMLEPLIVGREQEASRQALRDAALSIGGKGWKQTRRNLRSSGLNSDKLETSIEWLWLRAGGDA